MLCEKPPGKNRAGTDDRFGEAEQMPESKKMLHIFKRSGLQVVGLIIILLSALMLLWHENATSNQAMNAISARIQFTGEYRVADGPGQEIVEGEHIPAT